MAGGGIKINNIKVNGGADGATYVPSYNEQTGELSWAVKRNGKPVEGYSTPPPTIIKGKDGKDGKDGEDGEKGATGAKIVRQFFIGQDQEGGNSYTQVFDDGTTTGFTAPKGSSILFYNQSAHEDNSADIDLFNGTPRVGDLFIDGDGYLFLIEEIFNTYVTSRRLIKLKGESGGGGELSEDYVKFDDIPTQEKTGVIKLSKYSSAFTIADYEDDYGALSLVASPTGAIDSRVSFFALTLDKIDYAWKSGATNTEYITYTEEEKYAVRNKIGAVGTTDYATSTIAGVVKGDKTFGFQVNANGIPTCDVLAASEYGEKTVACFIGKGTLENAKNDIVKRAIVGNDVTLTDAEKTSACEWMGALKKDTSADGYARVYAILPDGRQDAYKIATSDSGTQAGRVVYLRSAESAGKTKPSATIAVDDPVNPYAAANKKFVEDKIGAKVVLDVTLTEEQAGANSVAVAIQDIDALVNAKRLFLQIRVPNSNAVAANKCWFTVNIADKNKSVYNSCVHTGYNLALSANKTVDIIANIFISTSQTQDKYYSYQSVCQPANDHLSASANSKTNAVTINGIIALGVIKETASAPPYLHIASSDTGAIPFVAGTRFYMEAY